MSNPFLVFLGRLAKVRQNKAGPFLIVLFAIFLFISLTVRSSDLIRSDIQFTLSLQRFQTPLIDRLAAAFTFMGNTATLIALGVVAFAVYMRINRPRAAWLMMITLLGLPLDYLLKVWIQRPRPTASVVEIILPALGLSFPSGHALGSVLFYGFLAFLIWVHVAVNKVRILGVSGLVSLIIGIGLSRIYLGVHWLSDVLGGWTSGLFCLLVVVEIYKAAATPDLAPAPAAVAPTDFPNPSPT